MNWLSVINKLKIDVNMGFRLPLKTELQFGDSNERVWPFFALISKRFSPLFEFGTFRGSMTEVFALNSPNKIYTIDIGNSDDLDIFRKDYEYELYGKYVIGKLFKDKKIKNNIIQLIGNTTKFDFKPYYNKFGLIFIDGGHSYEVCMSDSLNAFKMLKPGGIIIWDDCKWNGVSHCIQKLQQTYNIDIIEHSYGIYKNEKQ